MPRVLNAAALTALQNELADMVHNLSLVHNVTDKDVRQQFHDILTKLSMD